MKKIQINTHREISEKTPLLGGTKSKSSSNSTKPKLTIGNIIKQQKKECKNCPHRPRQSLTPSPPSTSKKENEKKDKKQTKNNYNKLYRIT